MVFMKVGAIVLCYVTMYQDPAFFANAAGTIHQEEVQVTIGGFDILNWDAVVVTKAGQREGRRQTKSQKSGKAKGSTDGEGITKGGKGTKSSGKGKGSPNGEGITKGGKGTKSPKSISQAPSLSPSLSLNPTMTVQKSDSIGSGNNDSGQTFFVKLFQGGPNSSAPTVLRLGKYIDFRGDLNQAFLDDSREPEFVAVEFSDNCSDIQQKLINVGNVDDPSINNSANDWVIDMVPDNWAVVDVADCLVEDPAGSGNWGLNIVVDPSNTVSAGYFPGILWEIRFNIVDVEN